VTTLAKRRVARAAEKARKAEAEAEDSSSSFALPLPSPPDFLDDPELTRSTEEVPEPCVKECFDEHRDVFLPRQASSDSLLLLSRTALSKIGAHTAE